MNRRNVKNVETGGIWEGRGKEAPYFQKKPTGEPLLGEAAISPPHPTPLIFSSGPIVFVAYGPFRKAPGENPPS